MLMPLMVFAGTATLSLKKWIVVIIAVHVRNLVLPSLRKGLSEEKKTELDELRKRYKQQNGYNVIKMYECDWWKL